MHAFAASAGGVAGGIGVALLIVAAIAAYWIPAIVAWVRRVPNAGSVTVLNALLGWTLVGWAIALAMACRTRYVATVPYAAPGQFQPPAASQPQPVPQPLAPRAPQSEREMEGYR